MPTRIRELIDIRPEERDQTAAMFAYIFLVIAVLAVVKSVRASLFLQTFGAASLPYVYLLIAGVAGTIATLYQRFAKSVPIQRQITWTMFVVIPTLIIFRLVAGMQWQPLAYVFYVWVALYGILTTAQFWMLANCIYDSRQAKRLFGILGVGASLGGIAGGYITQFSVKVVGTENLLLVGAVMLGCCVYLAAYLTRRQAATIRDAERVRRFKASSAERVTGGFKLIWESRYLKLIMAVIALSIIISTVVDNQFSFVVEEHIPDMDAKTAFFGQFFTWLGWAAFLAQCLLTSRVIRRYGIGIAMAILPAALIFGSGLFVLIPVLATGALVKIADGTFRYTTHKASLELLFLPVSIGVQNKTRTFIGVFTDRFSKSIAALIVILITTVLGFHYTVLSWVMMGLALCWIFVTVVTRREYVRAFRESLVRGHMDEDQLVISPTDASTISALAESLGQSSGPEAARLLDLLIGVRSPELVEPLVKLSHDPNPVIAAKALDRLAEQEAPDVGERLKAVLDSRDVEIVSRVIFILSSEGKKIRPERLGPYLGDDRPLVRLGTVMCVLRHGGAEGSDQIDAGLLEQFLQDSGTDQEPQVVQRMLASLLRVLPQGALALTYIQRFLRSDDPILRDEAIKAAGRLRPPELIAPLVQELGTRSLRYRVRSTLAAYGESALDQLEEQFSNPAIAPAIRRYLPRVLERIPTQRAVYILVAGLDDPDAQVRFAALRSLGKLRAKEPQFNYQRETIKARIEGELRKAYRYQDWVMTTADGEPTALLRKTLHEKARKSLGCLFRLLAMHYRAENLYAAWQALSSPNAQIRTNAIEYLANVLRPPQKRLVMELVADKPTRVAIRRGLDELGEPSADWPATLEQQAAAEDDWLAACALHTVWAVRQKDLFWLIEGSGQDSCHQGPLVKETVENLRRRLATNGD